MQVAVNIGTPGRRVLHPRIELTAELDAALQELQAQAID
jgi:hypothetical protein